MTTPNAPFLERVANAFAKKKVQSDQSVPPVEVAVADSTEDFDPLRGIDPKETEWIALTQRAKQRQEAAREGYAVPPTEQDRDDERSLALLRQAQQAGRDLSPAELSALAKTGQLATAPAASVVPVQAGPARLSFWVATNDEGVNMRAASWKDLKARLATMDGVFNISNIDFDSTSENVLGWLGVGYPLPDIVERLNFAVLVQKGIVFRSDPE